MKYYVVRERQSSMEIQRTKCLDNFTPAKNFQLCWEFSKQGAQKICSRKNELDRSGWRYYPVDTKTMADAMS